MVGKITQQEYRQLLSVFTEPRAQRSLLPFDYLRVNPSFRPDEPLGHVGSYVWPKLAMRASNNFRKSILEKELVQPITVSQCSNIEKSLRVLLTVRTEEVEGEKWGQSQIADAAGIGKLVDSFLPAACKRFRDAPKSLKISPPTAPPRKQVPAPKSVVEEVEEEGWPLDWPVTGAAFRPVQVPGMHFVGRQSEARSFEEPDDKNRWVRDQW